MSQCSCITFLFLIEHIKCKFTIALVSCKSAFLFSLVSELLIPNTEAECWFAGLGPPERIVPIIRMTWKGNVTESPESLLLTTHHPIIQCSQTLRVLIIKEKIYNTILASVSCSYEKQVWFFQIIAGKPLMRLCTLSGVFWVRNTTWGPAIEPFAPQSDSGASLAVPAQGT